MSLTTSPVSSPSLGTDQTRVENIRTALEKGMTGTAAKLFADLGVETQKAAFELLCAKFRGLCIHGNVVRNGVHLVYDDPSRLLEPVEGVIQYDYSKEGKRGNPYQPRIIDCLFFPHTHVRVKLPEKPEETSDDTLTLPQKFYNKLHAEFTKPVSPAPAILSAQQKSPDEKSPNDWLIDFYHTTGPKGDGVYLKDILEKWDDDRLENDQDYIHWLFPGMGNEGNDTAPALASAPEIVKLFQNNHIFHKYLWFAFERMLKFYGLEFRHDGIGNIHRIQGHQLKWLTGHHHHKRITQILGCLKNLGHEGDAKKFLVVLEDIAKNEGKGKIPTDTLKTWRKAVSGNK